GPPRAAGPILFAADWFAFHRFEDFMITMQRKNLLGVAGLAVALLTALAAADSVKLKTGSVLTGKILKQNEKSVWLDVGPNVVEFNMDDVDSVQLSEGEKSVEVQSDSLFHTAANLREMSPKEQAKRIGAAVIKVSTPAGLGSGVIISEDGYA